MSSVITCDLRMHTICHTAYAHVVAVHCLLWSLVSVDGSIPTCGEILHALSWRHNEHNCVSNHQPCVCSLNRLFRCRSKKTSKLRVTGLCAGNSPVTGEFPAQRASDAENGSFWWRHHGILHWYKDNHADNRMMSCFQLRTSEGPLP